MATATRSRTGRGRYARAATHRGQGLRRRRAPKPTGMKKVLTAVRPRTAAKKAAPRSKKGMAGGLALVAAAAGVAFKNRGKLTAKRGQQAAGPPGTPVA
jgi:hypothetical protein